MNVMKSSIGILIVCLSLVIVWSFFFSCAGAMTGGESAPAGETIASREEGGPADSAAGGRPRSQSQPAAPAVTDGALAEPEAMYGLSNMSTEEEELEMFAEPGASDEDAMREDPSMETPEEPVENFFYVSYDDSASTVGVELIKYALTNGNRPQARFARPWEFLNYEDFAQQNLTRTGVFKINMGLWNHQGTDPEATQPEDVYELGIQIVSPTISKDERRNAVITLVVDVSGSMDDPLTFDSGKEELNTRLDAAKYGMVQMLDSLKQGDVINLVIFSEDAETLLQEHKYSPENNDEFIRLVEDMNTIAGTYLEVGLEEGYHVAKETYDPNKINRVILLTDAYANIGEVDPDIIAESTVIENEEGIYFSGLGFGADFNEAFLNVLTEVGKGAYFSIITPADARRAFQDRFIALLNVAARDVRFRLDFPQNFTHGETASEELSTVAAEVQPTNFSFNTSQFFLESFKLPNANFNDVAQDNIILTITYKDPITFDEKEEIYSVKVADILAMNEKNIKDAYIVTLLPLLISGKVSPEEGNKRLALLQGHNTPLATEYRSLIREWYNITGQQAILTAY